MWTCLPDGQSSDPALIRLRTYRPLDMDPDGMSGGSAFAIFEQNGEFTALFAGVITRGGSGYFHAVMPGVVVAFLHAAFPTLGGG